MTYTKSYGYDLADRVSSITYPDGMQVSYSRDTLGRITGVTATVNGVSQTITANRNYRADGLLSGQRFGNGLTETRSYDLRGLLTEQTLGSETWSYAHDANGNLLSRALPSAAVSYAFDAVDRLTGETSPVESMGYAYDANGNRLTRTENGKTVTYSYTPNSNRMLRINKKQDVTLDAAGNTIADRDGKRTFAYDSAGHLKQVALNGEARGNYAYNAFHQRTRKLKKNGVVFIYHHDQEGRLIAESRDGKPWKDYIWADDGPIAQIRVHKNAKGKLLVKDIVYITADHLNTPRIGTDANAQIVWRWEGDAFGDSKSDNDPDEDDQNVTVNLRFPGQYFDSETVLHYNWNRYYDPKTGRYISSDPVELDGGLNTYSYVNGNPLRYTDPLGLVYYCTSPLHAWPSGDLNGVGPFHHAFLCDSSGSLCGGQDRIGNGLLSPGKPSEGDRFNSDRCEKLSDSDCMNRCVIEEIQNPRRPPYTVLYNPIGSILAVFGIPVTQNCQDWAKTTYLRCGLKCSKP